MPDIAYSILSVICALFIVAALFTDPATDEDVGYQFIGALIFLPIIALAIAGFSFILPFLLTGLGIVALVAFGLLLLYLLWKLLDTNFMRGLFHELFKGIGNVLKALFGEIHNILKNLPSLFGKVFRGLWNALKAMGRWLRLLIKSPFKALSMLWKGLKSLWYGLSKFLNTLMKLPGFLGKLFRGIGKMVHALAKVFGNVFNFIADILSGIARFFGGILEFIGDFISGVFKILWNAAPWMRPILGLAAKAIKMIAGWLSWLWLLLLLPFFLLFRRRKKDEKEKKVYVQPLVVISTDGKSGRAKYVLPAKKVPTVLRGVSNDLIDILNSTHKHIRHIKNH